MEATRPHVDSTLRQQHRRKTTNARTLPGWKRRERGSERGKRARGEEKGKTEKSRLYTLELFFHEIQSPALCCPAIIHQRVQQMSRSYFFAVNMTYCCIWSLFGMRSCTTPPFQGFPGDLVLLLFEVIIS